MRPRRNKEFSLVNKLHNYSQTNTFGTVLNSTERRAWRAFENVCRNFLGNEKGGKIRVKLCRS